MAMDYCIEDEARLYAWDLVQRCNFGKRGKFDGDMVRQYTGVLAETFVADLLGCPRPVAAGGPDGGVDFLIYEKRIDLKVMGRNGSPSPYMVNNLLAAQVDGGETCVYLFGSLNKQNCVLTLVGWLKKIELQRAWLVREGVVRERKDGTRFAMACDSYEVPSRGLHPFTNATTFVTEMGMFC